MLKRFGTLRPQDAVAWIQKLQARGFKALLAKDGCTVWAVLPTTVQ
jgi:hypothetical protein